MTFCGGVLRLVGFVLYECVVVGIDIVSCCLFVVLGQVWCGRGFVILKCG